MTAEPCPYKVVSPKHPPQEPCVSDSKRKALAVVAVACRVEIKETREREREEFGKELFQKH